jgi:hypothetical protein
MATLTLLAGERQPGESDKAVVACNDWLRLGPGRTLGLLLAKYAGTRRNAPPTDSLATLKHWSEDYKWADRGASFDAQVEEQKNAERQRVMSSGFAQDYARVRELDKAIRFLLRQIYAHDNGGPNGESPYFNVFARNAKMIGGGLNAERVDYVEFDGAPWEVLRGLLDDAAKETGGRKQQLQHGGKITVTLSPQELATAREELDQWEKERFGANA